MAEAQLRKKHADKKGKKVVRRRHHAKQTVESDVEKTSGEDADEASEGLVEEAEEVVKEGKCPLCHLAARRIYIIRFALQRVCCCRILLCFNRAEC